MRDLIEGIVEIVDGMGNRLAVLIDVENVFLFIELLLKLAERGPEEFGFLGVVRVLLEILLGEIHRFHVLDLKILAIAVFVEVVDD